MRRLLIALVTSIALGLVGGVGTAYAADGLLPPTSQSATQSNDASNTADQSATSVPLVASGPNVAIANGGSSCNPCGEGGSTTQNSGNTVNASSSNTATQTNNQSNAAGQIQTVGGGSSGDPSQSADQSNDGSNTAKQSATSAPVVISGPNVAALNSGDVHQNSGNNVNAPASNNANQSNTQSNGASQSQTVAENGCCSSSGASQSAKQSNDGSNSADQKATSAPVVISGGNYAILNKGDVNQNSGNWVNASSSNSANQTNHQSNSAGQSQTVADGGNCCSKDSGVSQSADQSNTGSNEANQSATSAPVVVSGPNVAIANGWGHDLCNSCGEGGDVNQSSGNWVWAPASNHATQTNSQTNALGQSQTVNGDESGCCRSGDPSQSASQSNSAENEANQSAVSAPVVISGGNFAILNKDDVNQNSGNWVWAPASNHATQTNSQTNALGQLQRVNGGESGCCGSGDVSQSASQSNSAENEANQSAVSAPVVISGGNFAILNKDDVNQNSGNWVWAPASNHATQTNSQTNALGQSQTVNREGCCRETSNPCESKCNSECGSECESRCEQECQPRCEQECQPRCEPTCDSKKTTLTRRLGVI